MCAPGVAKSKGITTRRHANKDTVAQGALTTDFKPIAAMRSLGELAALDWTLFGDQCSQSLAGELQSNLFAETRFQNLSDCRAHAE